MMWMPLSSSRSRGARIKAYVDTNIYVYAILHHPEYWELCAEILRDVEDGVFEAYGSVLVAVELLESLSRIGPRVARRAVEAYLSLGMAILGVDVSVVKLASVINEVADVGYDAVHAALMILNEVPTVITNDLDDWERIQRRFAEIVERLREEGFSTSLEGIDVVSPAKYREWRRLLK